MEVINDLLEYNNMKIIQDNETFNFSLDSVLLPNFVTINKKINNILDIGCGNAPIPLIISTKTDAKIIGVEIQSKIADMAMRSVEINNKQNQIKIINQDINDFYKYENTGKYDIITCNPPFFKNERKSHKNNSEYKTIARHEVKLNLEQIMQIGKKLLKNNGVIALVHRPERLVEILELMKQYNIEPKKLQFVYPKTNKEAKMILIEGRKNGKSGLKILPPIYVHTDNNDYTEQVKLMFK
jgi:tRNA1(Val) A37 N6-methylase TrmN6